MIDVTKNLQFEVGTDIVFIPKMQKTIEENPNFVNKIFTEKEIEIAKKIKVPYNFYATRFAAKEAIIKATNGLYDFKEIEILKGNSGEPIPTIIGHLEYEIKLSLSYDNDYATSFCIVQKK